MTPMRCTTALVALLAACTGSKASESASQREPQAVEAANAAAKVPAAGDGTVSAPHDAGARQDVAMSSEECPPGAAPRSEVWRYGDPPREGRKEWCERADGTRHGYWRWWWADDVPREQGFYADGIEHGAWKRFHRNGRLYQEGSYRSGKQHGAWRTHGGSGSLSREERFDEGARVGKVTVYWPNGQVSEAGQYEDGEPHGTWISYSRTGRPSEKTVYRRGTIEASFEHRNGDWVPAKVDDEDIPHAPGNGPYVPPGAYDVPGGNRDAEHNPGE